MARIKPKLYLNMSPQTQEENTLAFARNLKIDDDGSLVSDYGYETITPLSSDTIVGHIVGLDNKVYFFTSNNHIVEYDEITKLITRRIQNKWHYNGGEIDGYVSTNQSGEIILTVAEYKENGHVPLKHINLSYYDVANESLYSQAPEVPITNLTLVDTYVKTIPNGTYIFFIRYKIRKDVYTPWYLCSHPIFGGTSEKITTLQGGLQYINLHKDAAKSFVFDVSHVNPGTNNAILNLYSEFQIGFIINHDEASDARIWKSFPIATTRIWFDYEDIKDANIDDLLESTYELYNVRNVTSFKNKLYISNYVESDFNPSVGTTLASKINVGIDKVNGEDIVYKNMTFNGVNLLYNPLIGYYDRNTNGELISSIAYTLFTTNVFDYNISNLSKGEVKEKDDAVKFDIIWSANNDPDLACIYNIYNNLIGDGVFGPDYDEPYLSIIPNNQGTSVIKQLYSGSGLWIYGPTDDDTRLHPWYKLNLTFMYGSASDRVSGTDICRNGCWYFNGHSGTYIHPSDPDRQNGWPTQDKGFDDVDRNTIDNNIKTEVERQKFFAECYIEITSGAKSYKLGYSDYMNLDNYVGYDANGNREVFVLYNYDWASTSTMTAEFRAIIINTWILPTIKRYAVGIDETGAPILAITENDVTENVVASSISIVFKKFEFTLDGYDIKTDDTNYNRRYTVGLKTTDYISVCTFGTKASIVSVEDRGSAYSQGHTLMPLSTYKVYAHFVDNHNIITNGYYLNTLHINTDVENETGIIRLNYSVDSLSGISHNYKAFFLSIVNTGNIIVEGFGYSKHGTTNILHSIEIDSALYNLNDNITIVYLDSNNIEVTVTSSARYYSSGSSYPPLAFGNCGYIAWTDGYNYSDKRLYIKVIRNKQEQPTSLVKATPYIELKATQTTNVSDGFYGSYLCLIKKPSFELSSKTYVAGSDVYSIDRTASLSLSEFKSYVQVQNSITYIVRSNFNLNYLSLTEDIDDKIFNIGNASSGVKQVAKVINSATLSFIYELKSMYKDFANKLFRPVDTDYKINFDNTIRVSHVLSDETFNNSIFRFSAEDYYNVPTNRGVIVNLFAIGNNIFVHTQGSFYKFDANQTLSSSGTDITLQESEPFDTGISQVFDSEFGYGGILNKEAGCITFDSYFFYDASSNHIFGYGGNGQVNLIDGTIYKLLTIYKPTICKTIHDDINHRILFDFQAETMERFTLSYNYKAKSFVSLHDISLTKAFSSRKFSYSYNGKLCKLFTTEQGISNVMLDEHLNILALFGDASFATNIQFGGTTQTLQSTCFGLAIVAFPRQYARENVEFVTIDTDVIKDPIEEIVDEIEVPDEEPEVSWYDLIKVPQHTRENPIHKMYIITDCCISTPIMGTVDDTARPSSLLDDPSIPNSLLDYKGFKYDGGSWNSNFFRNALNADNVYHYPNQPRAGQVPNTDNNSLVYGKYFIIVLDFITNKPIKVENLYINSNKY